MAGAISGGALIAAAAIGTSQLIDDSVTADKIAVRGTIFEAGNDLAIIYGHPIRSCYVPSVSIISDTF